VVKSDGEVLLASLSLRRAFMKQRERALVFVLIGLAGLFASRWAVGATDEAALEMVWMQGGHFGYVNAVAFSPNGQWLATGDSEQSRIKLLRVADGIQVRTFMGHSGGIKSLAFTPDSTILISAANDATIKLWSTADGALLRTLIGHTAAVLSVAVSADGQFLASGSADNTVRIWRVSDGGLVRLLTGHGNWVQSVAYSRDGGMLASGSADGYARLWRVSDGASLLNLNLNVGRGVGKVAFSLDNNVLVIICNPGLICTWNISSATYSHGDIYGGFSWWNGVDISPDRSLILAASGFPVGNWVHYVNPDGTLARGSLAMPTGAYSVAFSPDGTLAATGGSLVYDYTIDAMVRLWRVSDQSMIWTLVGHSEGVNAVAISPDASLVATGSDDWTYRLWRPKDGSIIWASPNQSCDVSCAAFSQDGSKFASGGGRIGVWRVSDWSQLLTLSDHTAPVTSAMFSPDGSLLATSSKDQTVRLWRLDDGADVLTITGHAGEVLSVAFSPDGSTLASGGADKQIMLWKVTDGSSLGVISGHGDVVSGVAYSADGKTLASCSWDGTVRLWRTSDHSLRKILGGHTGRVNAVAFTPDGRVLASGSDDNTVRFWLVSDGTLLRTISRETYQTRCLAFSKDGRYLVYGRGDGTHALALNPWPNAISTSAGERLWVEDGLPAGAVTGSDGGDSWSWVSNNPLPGAGNLAHQSSLSQGFHQHYFCGATDNMQVNPADKLFAYVFLDPVNPPSEVMLQWFASGWEHRAYWGVDAIQPALNGAAYYHAGALPVTGQWVVLEVEASAVGLEGKVVSGMAFSLYDGKATWDHAGKASASSSWVDEGLPAGALTGSDGGDSWIWTGGSPAPYAGTSAHQSDLNQGFHQHYFYGAHDTMQVNPADRLFTYVWLDPANPPSEVMLQWFDGTWEHRAYWGVDAIQPSLSGAAYYHAGSFPVSGQWARLEVPAAAVGLQGANVSGMAFGLYGGQASWDHAGKEVSAPSWVEDGLPTGAILGSDGGDTWSWANNNPAPYAGALAHQSSPAPSFHQHYFYGATQTMAVTPADKLFAYIWLDPANPPTEVLLQWFDGGWEHRAYWGANALQLSLSGAAYYHAGALPPAGQWTRLEVEAAAVGLEGQNVSGMAFGLYNGRAVWDHAGKEAVSPSWVEDMLPHGSVTGSDGGDTWTWLSSSPNPCVGALAHQSNLSQGFHQHYFYEATEPMQVNAADRLLAYVWLDPANPPTEVLLQWFDGSWEHRAYWGANALQLSLSGAAYYHAGALPAAGQWVRLEVAAAAVGLEGRTVSGMAFGLYDGKATWDHAGKVTPSYSISGYVKTSGGSGISGVTMSGFPGNPSTDGNGYYSASVPSRWSGTATPGKSGYTFNPASRTYSNVTGNQSSEVYTGTAQTLLISGYVKNSGGLGIGGVTMSGLPGDPSTDFGGYYSGSVSYGWSGTVTPSSSGYTFDPASRAYSSVTGNRSNEVYTATDRTFLISGYVKTSGGSGISGVTMSGLPGNPSTDSNGYYNASVWHNWSGTVTPSKAGYTFIPASRTYSNDIAGDQAGQNYTPTEYAITAAAEAGGTISPSGSFAKIAGESQTFNALPNADYEVNQWLVNGVVAQLGGSTYTISDIRRSYAVQVSFAFSSVPFHTTSPLATGRYLHTATLLPNGNVLVAGGLGSNGGSLSSAEVYDSPAGAWAQTGSLNTARAYHTATLLLNGNVLVAGGICSALPPLSGAELYDAGAGRWTVTGPLTTVRSYHTATLLSNGKVLVVGGSSGVGMNSSAELYDPATKTWTPTGALNTARLFHTATLLPNGNVLVAGGIGSTLPPFSGAELYDPNTGIWTPTGAMHTARYNHTGTLVPSGEVLAAGGYGNGGLVSGAELYDPSSGTWTATGAMNVGRDLHTATLLPSGKTLIIGGRCNLGPVPNVESYDPVTGSWTVVGAVSVARVLHTATLLRSGQVLVAGGYDLTNVVSSAEVYDSQSLGR
jgi:WD40 repeat protein